MKKSLLIVLTLIILGVVYLPLWAQSDQETDPQTQPVDTVTVQPQEPAETPAEESAPPGEEETGADAEVTGEPPPPPPEAESEEEVVPEEARPETGAEAEVTGEPPPPPPEAESEEEVVPEEARPEPETAAEEEITEEETPVSETPVEAEIPAEEQPEPETAPEATETPAEEEPEVIEEEIEFIIPEPQTLREDIIVDRREIGNLVFEDIPEIPEEITGRLQRYENVRSAGFQGWDAKGEGLFITTRFGETRQAHYVAVPGGTRQQITFFDEPISDVSVRPDSMNMSFLFAMDEGGTEVAQLYYYNMEDGSYDMLTDGESRNSGGLWYKDGTKFSYVSTRRNGTDFDIYTASMENPKEAEMVFESQGYWGPMDWSPDGTKLLIYNYISSNQSRIYILDLASGDLKPLIDQEGEFAIGSGVYRPDGRRIYFVSNFEGEFSKLYYYDVKDGKIKNLTKKIEWDISGLTVANDGKNLAFTVNENGTERLYIMNTFTNWFSMVDQIPAGTIGAMEFNPAGDKIAFTLNTPQTGDVYSYDLKTNQLMRWTYSEVGGLNPDAFVMPELIHYPTFDNIDSLTQRTIPAYYFKPPGEGPFPVVIYLHGGPEGQFTPYFSSTFNFWLNELGIAILAPNVRGSSGYGKSFLKLDNGFLRENSVKDAGALLDWIEKQPELNSDRIGVMGGSYGGYMVLSMMTHYNDRIAAGVDNVGISNFVTFLKNTGDYRRDLRRAEYGDERGVKMHNFLIRISPLTNASKITKPLFVVQGLNDPRVPVTEAEQMVTVIRNNGGDVWYLLGKDEGHGFSKKTNYDYYRAATVLFWQEYLLK